MKQAIQYIKLRNQSKKHDRIERRRAKVEIDHFMKTIQPIEEDFLMAIMQSEDNDKFTYRSIYTHYLMIVVAIVDYYNKSKYRTIEVNSHYFEKQFRPIEDEQKTGVFCWWANLTNQLIVK